DLLVAAHEVDLERGAVVRERVKADVRRAVGGHRHQPSELLRANEPLDLRGRNARVDVMEDHLFTGSPRTAGPGSQARLACGYGSHDGPATCCGSHDHHRLASHGGTPAPRRAPARTTITGSPRTAGPQPRDVLRLARPSSRNTGARSDRR